MSEKILKFWFGEDLSLLNKPEYKFKSELWFRTQWETDELIKNNFHQLLIDAENNKLQDWETDPKSALALILLLDQFSRNIYRGISDMFKNDQKALDISLNLLKHEDKMTQFSLIEKFFIYLPLLHIEDSNTALKCLDLIDTLCQQSPDSHKKQFQKFYGSTKVHIDLLLKHGRYPHRNSLLHRESTEDELNFLRKSKHNFVKSVLPVQKPDTENSNSKTNKLKIKKQKSQFPFQNILFLHGFRQSSNKIKKRASRLVNTLKSDCNAHLTFLNGTHSYAPKGEIADQLNSTLGNETLNPIESQRVWYNSDDDAEVYYGIDESIDHVLTHAKLNGPYDGIIGFGQGAVLASIVARKYPNIFRYLIAISAFEPRSLRHKDLFTVKDKFDFPSLHVYGKNDVLITPSRSEQFSKCFKDAKIAEHSAGHFAPDSWPFESIVEFIRVQGENLKPVQFLEGQDFELNIIRLNDSLLRFEVDSLDLKPLFNTNWGKSVIESVFFKHFFNDESQNSIDEFGKVEDLKDLNDKLMVIYLILLKAKKVEVELEIKSFTFTILTAFLKLYVSNDEFKQYLMNEVLDFLFINTNNWRDLIHMCDLCSSLKSDIQFERYTNDLDKLYNCLIERFTKQLILDLSYIDRVKNRFYVQELTSIRTEGENHTIDNTDEAEKYHVTDLAIFMPRIKTSIDKRSRIGRECAEVLNPYKELVKSSQNEAEIRKVKVLSYNHYRKVLSAICHFLTDSKKTFQNRNPRQYYVLSKFDKKMMEYLMEAPLSDAIINPVPEPVDISPHDQMQPLYDWLKANKLASFNELDLKFLRGTVTTDGRLDLCKQVIGPQGIEPLLNSMKDNKNINRLLLGNNIVGDKAGKSIAEFIKSGKSPLVIWYIAGNGLTVEGITPITEALMNDKQVTALWLKRNPLKAAGMHQIGNLMRHNTTIQALDLLNCGLLDDGVKILFDSLKENNTLKHLYLSANGITPVGLESIKEYYKTGKSSLETLFLGCNRIGNKGAKIIGEMLKDDSKLERLNLTSCRIGAEGMKYLAESLMDHPSLVLLDLGFMKATMDLGELGNYIEDEGAFYLSKLIEKSTKLRSLNFTHNHIKQKGMQLIVDAIKINKSLYYVDYVQSGSSLNEITLTVLRNSLDRNRKLLALTRPEFDPESIIMPDHVKEIYSVYRTH